MTRPPTEEELIAEIEARRLRPCAFQALWDGDTEGWFIRLEVVIASGQGPRTCHRAVALTFPRFGGDIRLFQGEAPPWPEARIAAELGEALARRYDVPFHFPSPDDPDDGCPNWWEQNRAIRCADCGKQILPPESPHLPKDICYHCHIAREARARLRSDEPHAPDGVHILCIAADGGRRPRRYVGGSGISALVDLALADATRATEAHERGELVLAGDTLVRLAAELQAQIEHAITELDARPVLDQRERDRWVG